MEENRRIKSEVHYTQWENWVILETSLVQDIDTGDDRTASWQWSLGTEWIRLDE